MHPLFPILLSYLIKGRLPPRCVVRLSGGGSEERLSSWQSFSLVQHISLDVLETTSMERGTQAGARKVWLGGDCRSPGWQQSPEDSVLYAVTQALQGWNCHIVVGQAASSASESRAECLEGLVLTSHVYALTSHA